MPNQDRSFEEVSQELVRLRIAINNAARDGNDEAMRELGALYRDLSIGNPHAMRLANARYREVMGSLEDRERMEVKEEKAKKRPGDASAITPGLIRGATGLTGIPGDIGNVTPDIFVSPYGAFKNPLQYFPSTDEQRQFLSGMGFDTTTGEGTSIGDLSEFVGGGYVGGLRNIGRQTAAGGLRGFGLSTGRNVGASGAAFVGSEAGGNLAENIGLEPIYGQIPGALAPAFATRAGGRIATGASQRQRVANRQASKDALLDAETISTEISLGTATPNQKTKFFERLMASMPGGIRVMHQFALKANESMVNNLRRVTEQTGRLSAGVGIHTAINKGIQEFRRKSDWMFSRAQRIIPEDQFIRIRGFKSAVQDLAVELPKTLDEVTAVLKGGSGIDAESLLAAVNKMDRGVGGMTFREADALRRYIGGQLRNSSNLIDAGRHADLKFLYGALTEDIGSSLSGTQKYMWETARDHWKKGIENVDNFLRPVVGRKGDTDFEAMFNRLFSDNAASIQKLNAVYKTMTPQQRDLTTKAFIYRLGRTGEADSGITMDFAMGTFLKNWKDIPKRNLDVMFQDSPAFRENMDAFVRHIDRVLKTNAAFANPSQSGPVGLAAATAYFALAGMTGAAVGYAFSPEEQQAEGTGIGTAAALLMAAGGVAGGSRLMTHQGFVKWLAEGTRVANNKTGEHFGQLVALGRDDPYIQEALSELMENIAMNTDQRNLLNDGLVGPRVELVEQ